MLSISGVCFVALQAAPTCISSSNAAVWWWWSFQGLTFLGRLDWLLLIHQLRESQQFTQK